MKVEVETLIVELTNAKALLERAVEMLRSLSVENGILTGKLSPVCNVCREPVLPVQDSFNSVIGVIHIQCIDGFKKMMVGKAPEVKQELAEMRGD